MPFATFSALYETLAENFAFEPHWWPLFSPLPCFEIMLGAVLVQQTRWETVEAAIQRLLVRGWLSPAALAAADTAELAQLIRPCAFHTQKAPGIQAISRYLLAEYAGDPAPLLAKPRAELRAELLALPRIGRETADTIMLYAGEHPLFIVDAYARRLLGRVGMLPGLDMARAPYDTVQTAVEQQLAAEAAQGILPPVPSSAFHAGSTSDMHRFSWNFHALINEACIHHCLTAPRCDLPGARRRFLDPRKCAEHCLECSGCPLRQGCAAYARGASSSASLE